MKFRYNSEKEELILVESSRTEYHQLSIWLTRYVKNYKFTPQYKMGVWNGTQTYFRDGKINLGLWREALLASREIGVSFSIENKEDFPINRDLKLEDVVDFCKEFFKAHRVRNKNGEWVEFSPYDHQIQTAYKILKNRFCMAEVATSGGKSLIISIVIFYTLTKVNPSSKFLIIVPSITLVTQFYDNIVEYNSGANFLAKDEPEINKTLKREIGPLEIGIEEVMSDRPRKYSGNKNANIYIGTYQSLEKWPAKFFKQFHTVITDECLHPNTKIEMSDGGIKNISDVRVGDFVKTINEITGQKEDKKVEHIYKNLSNFNFLYRVKTICGYFIEATPNHKVLLKNNEWKRVDMLNIKDVIVSIDYDKSSSHRELSGEIISIEKYNYKGDVYNLRIESNHNYFANGLCVSNCHQAKAKSYLKILGKTFNSAYSRFGVSGTTPPDDSCEILTLQSVLGPKITEVTADELKNKGIITPMDIKAIMLNHSDSNFLEKVKLIRKGGMGKEALDLEKDYIHISEKRLEFIKKLIDKCDKNTLVLFHTIEYGKAIFNKLKSELEDKEFFYIDGEISGKNREAIKAEMEITKKSVEYTILCFADYELELESDTQILLTDGTYKKASDITQEDDIDDNFIEKLKNNLKKDG
jgi:superfamily II DNA or RNA helicase